MNDIEAIVGKDKAFDWEYLNPKVFYKDGEPYGLIYVDRMREDILYVYGCAKDNAKFSRKMVAFILRLMKTDSVCLLTESEQHKEHIKNMISRYGFVFVDGDDDILYSFYFKQGEA